MKDFIQDYSAILVGLLVGSLAHFGRMVTEGKMPRPLQVFGFFMQLGLIGLLAAVVTKKLDIVDPDMRALSTAILAVSAQEVIQFIKKRSWRPLLDALMHIIHNPLDPHS